MVRGCRVWVDRWSVSTQPPLLTARLPSSALGAAAPRYQHPVYPLPPQVRGNTLHHYVGGFKKFLEQRAAREAQARAGGRSRCRDPVELGQHPIAVA